MVYWWQRQVEKMKSEVRTFPYPNGEIQRVQAVRLDTWQELEFLRPNPAEGAFEGFCRIYEQFLIPAAPYAFGNIVMFRLPEGVDVPFSHETGSFGAVADPLTAAAVGLRRGVRVHGKRIRFRDEITRQFWKELEEHRSVRIVRGMLPITTVIPVGSEAGLLSETDPDAAMKVNANFFIMDPFDCATPYDHIGFPFGLLVKDGIVEQPPLFGREALLVRKDGSVRIETPELKNLRVHIGEKVFVYGEKARFYSRPNHPAVFAKKALVVIGRKVVAVRENGLTTVPGAGFVICPEGDCTAKPGDRVTYEGMEDILFGIQVGNSILRDGVKTDRFISRFYNIKTLQPVPYPPCLYPMDFRNARAARIALGADAEGKPMLLWAEGAAKLGHEPGVDSCGATLPDMARICAEVGMVNAVNLDGGGSAQILLKNARSLMISDRKAEDFSESERSVPLGLTVR